MGSRERERGVKKTSGEQLNINIIITGWGGGESNTHEHVKTRFKLLYLIHQNNSSSSFLQTTFSSKRNWETRGRSVFFSVTVQENGHQLIFFWFSQLFVWWLDTQLYQSRYAAGYCFSCFCWPNKTKQT